MGCRLRIFLTTAENRTLKELRKAQSVPQRTQDRAQVLLLNARGWKNHQIAEYLDWTERTVRQTIHRWQAQGLVGLFDAARPGRKPRWQEQGLYLFFLPKYCSQMNPIEPEWHQLKTHELAGRMFEDEYDLALAVIEGVEHRGQQGQYSTERFKFNSS